MIELLVSIAVFGVVSVTFLGALVLGYGAIVRSHDQTMAESLTRTKFEEIKGSAGAVQDHADIVDNYDIVVTTDNITDSSTYAPYSGPADYQMITVTISNRDTGRVILETRDSKAL